MKREDAAIIISRTISFLEKGNHLEDCGCTLCTLVRKLYEIEVGLDDAFDDE
jgi:hypothetical protein